MIDQVGIQFNPNLYQVYIGDDGAPPDPPPGTGGSSGGSSGTNSGSGVGTAQTSATSSDTLRHLEIRPGEQAETGDQSFGRNSDGDTFELSAEARKLIGG